MGFCISLITDGLSLRLFSLELSTMSQTSEISFYSVKQGHFWPFAPRQLVEVIFCPISSFQLNLADNYYFQENLEMFTYK